MSGAQAIRVGREEELLDAARGGDEAAFGRLVDAYRRIWRARPH